MNNRQLRLLRAASASAVATLLAAASHTIAGGAAPHPLLVAAVAILVIPVAALLIGVRASRLRVALTVLFSQAAFHLVFQLLGAPTGATAFTGHTHHAGLALDIATLGPVAAASAPDTLMLVGHVAAAVVTTLLVWHGESMVRATARWVHATLRRAVLTVTPAHEDPLALDFSIPLLVDTALSASLSRRGPPALA